MPKTNFTFWKEKFHRNIERDRKACEDLRGMGWDVMVIWECEISDAIQLGDRLSSFLGDKSR